MKYLNRALILFSSIIFSISCSKDDTINNLTLPIQTSFTIQLTPSLTTVSVDQAFTIGVNANENIKAMWVSLDNFATGGYAVQNFGINFTLNFNFDILGQKTISIRCKNSNNQITEKKIIINVVRGGAIKITGLEVVSFYNINGTYDPEFPNTNPNHLADLQFGFAKSKIGSYLENNYSFSSWYLSSVIENQGTMIWNTNSANLYINPNNSLRFGLVDIDNGIAGADLLNGPPDYRTISFSSYIATKPNVITYTYPEINLEIKLNVEWAN